MPTNNEKINEYINEFSRLYFSPMDGIYAGDLQHDRIKSFLRSTLSSHAAFIEGEVKQKINKAFAEFLLMHWNGEAEVYEEIARLEDFLLLLLANPKTDETK
jgi:hypothetical protein